MSDVFLVLAAVGVPDNVLEMVYREWEKRRGW